MWRYFWRLSSKMLMNEIEQSFEAYFLYAYLFTTQSQRKKSERTEKMNVDVYQINELPSTWHTTFISVHSLVFVFCTYLQADCKAPWIWSAESVPNFYGTLWKLICICRFRILKILQCRLALMTDTCCTDLTQKEMEETM